MNCECLLPAIQRVAKPGGPNGGKAYFACGNNSKCSFFQWVGSVIPPSLQPRIKAPITYGVSSMSAMASGTEKRPSSRVVITLSIAEMEVHQSPFSAWFAAVGVVNSHINNFFLSFPEAYRRYKETGRVWQFNFEIYEDFVSKAHSFEFQNIIEVVELPRFIPKGVNHMIREFNKIPPISYDDINVEDGLRIRLESYQFEALRFVIQRGGRAFIGDEMGVGKTIEAIGVIQHYRQHWPVLIMMPPNLVKQWEEELVKFSGDLFSDGDIRSVKKGTDAVYGKICIVPYSILGKLVDNGLIRPNMFGVVIADESHNLKGKSAQRTVEALPFLKQAKVALCLSGTPSTNRPEELFTQLSSLYPCLFDDYYAFVVRYCAAKPSRFNPSVMDVSGSSNSTELQLLLKLIMIRRLKAEVLSGLANKFRELKYVDPAPQFLSQIKALQKEKDQIVKDIARVSGDIDKMRMLRNQEQSITAQQFKVTGDCKLAAIRVVLKTLLMEQTIQRLDIEETVYMKREQELFEEQSRQDQNFKEKVEVVDLEASQELPLQESMLKRVEALSNEEKEKQLQSLFLENDDIIDIKFLGTSAPAKLIADTPRLACLANTSRPLHIDDSRILVDRKPAHRSENLEDDLIDSHEEDLKSTSVTYSKGSRKLLQLRRSCRLSQGGEDQQQVNLSDSGSYPEQNSTTSESVNSRRRFRQESVNYVHKRSKESAIKDIVSLIEIGDEIANGSQHHDDLGSCRTNVRDIWEDIDDKDAEDLFSLMPPKKKRGKAPKPFAAITPNPAASDLQIDDFFVPAGGKSKKSQSKVKSAQSSLSLAKPTDSEQSKEAMKLIAGLGKKILIFAHHQHVIDSIDEYLYQEGIRHIRIDGGVTSMKTRNDLVHKFQEDDVTDVALLSIQACNSGINLTRANVALFAELHWSAGVILQAEDRIHRKGQSSASVRLIYLVARGTLDEVVWDQLQTKHNVLGATVGIADNRGYGMLINKRQNCRESTQATLDEFMSQTGLLSQQKGSSQSALLSQQSDLIRVQSKIVQPPAAAHIYTNGYDSIPVISLAEQQFINPNFHPQASDRIVIVPERVNDHIVESTSLVITTLPFDAAPGQRGQASEIESFDYDPNSQLSQPVDSVTIRTSHSVNHDLAAFLDPELEAAILADMSSTEPCPCTSAISIPKSISSSHSISNPPHIQDPSCPLIAAIPLDNRTMLAYGGNRSQFDKDQPKVVDTNSVSMNHSTKPNPTPVEVLPPPRSLSPTTLARIEAKRLEAIEKRRAAIEKQKITSEQFKQPPVLPPPQQQRQPHKLQDPYLTSHSSQSRFPSIPSEQGSYKVSYPNQNYYGVPRLASAASVECEINPQMLALDVISNTESSDQSRHQFTSARGSIVSVMLEDTEGAKRDVTMPSGSETKRPVIKRSVD